MPYELLSKGGIYTGLIILIAFLIHWLVKTFGDLLDRIMEESNKREELLKQELNDFRLEARQERKEFISTIDGYNHSLKEIASTIKDIQEDIGELKERR